MTICEHCGRAHIVMQPDARFCSILCRLQCEEYLANLPMNTGRALTPLDYQRTHAAWLAERVVSTTEETRQVLAATPSLASDPQLQMVHDFLLFLAADVSVAMSVHEFMLLSATKTAPTVLQEAE